MMRKRTCAWARIRPSFAGPGSRSKTSSNRARVLLDHPIADYAKHGFGRWACVLKSTGELIGFNGLKYMERFKAVDIGYRLLSRHWGKGYATEAALPCIDYGFKQLGLERIIGLVLPENAASIRVLTKLRMTDAGEIEHCQLTHRRFVLERADWRSYF